jgi:AcrR family transcriptional regulator
MDDAPAAAGRPRDAALDDRITAAALAVLRARGPEGVTVEAVAEHARCAKTSIYRRYRNSTEILAAALSGLARGIPPTQPGGSPRRQLVAALEQFRSGVEQEIGLRTVAAVLSDPASDFAQLMREQLLTPRLQVVADLVGEAVAVGELPATTVPDALVYGMAGSYFARLTLTGHVDPSWAQETVDQLPR